MDNGEAGLALTGARDLMLVEAVNDALHTELARDDNVMVMGEDVGRAGGVFRATAGLRERFGPDRCVDTPLAEAGILGTAVGLCMAGWRPVCEMQYDAFSYPCLDQLITHVGRAGGVFRATAGLRDRFGADRCVDTPLAEAGILGTAVGLSKAGWRPVCEMLYESFS